MNHFLDDKPYLVSSRENIYECLSIFDPVTKNCKSDIFTINGYTYTRYKAIDKYIYYIRLDSSGEITEMSHFLSSKHSTEEYVIMEQRMCNLSSKN